MDRRNLPLRVRRTLLSFAGSCVLMLSMAQPGIRVHMQGGTRMDVPFAAIDRVAHGQDALTLLPLLPAIAISMTEPRHFRVEVASAAANGSLVFARGVCWARNRDPEARDSVLQTAADGSLVDTLFIREEDTEFRFRSFAIGNGTVHYGPVAVLAIPVYPPGSGMFDGEGNYYRTAVIGTQEWMVDNLRSQHYSNGDAINLVVDDSDWRTTNSGAWCHPTTNPQGQAPRHGLLYNGYAANDGRNVCPAGWHVPVDADWRVLEHHVGVPDTSLGAWGIRGAAQAAGGALKAMQSWQPPNTGANDSSGFEALASGGRTYYNGDLFNAGVMAQFWVRTAIHEQPRLRLLEYDHAGVASYLSYSRSGASIRCVKD